MVERAIPPTAPTSPKPKVNIVLGLLLGLGVGVALALTLDTLDNTIKSFKEVNELTGMNPIGVIGYDSETATSPLSVLNTRSVRSEAYRAIRTNLQFVDVDNTPRVIVVVSALPGEGKTTTTLNVAIAFAQAGNRVALVEGDLRKPRVADYLGID